MSASALDGPRSARPLATGMRATVESGAGRSSGGLLAVGAVGAGLVGGVAVGMLVLEGGSSVAGLAQLAAQGVGLPGAPRALLAAGAGRVGHRAAGVAPDLEVEGANSSPLGIVRRMSPSGQTARVSATSAGRLPRAAPAGGASGASMSAARTSRRIARCRRQRVDRFGGAGVAGCVRGRARSGSPAAGARSAPTTAHPPLRHVPMEWTPGRAGYPPLPPRLCSGGRRSRGPGRL